MAISTNFANAESFQNYIRTYSEDFLSRAYYGHPEAQDFVAHEGIKDEAVLTELLVGDLAVRWELDYASRAGQLTFDPTVLKVQAYKWEIDIAPQQFESSYLGWLRSNGFNQDDIPMEAFIFTRVANKLRNEIGRADWQAVQTLTPASGDLLVTLYDGFLKKFTDLVTGGHTVIPVPGGAYTATNIIPHFKEMYDQLDSAYQYGDAVLQCRPGLARLYADNYVALHNGNEPERNERGWIRLEYGAGWIVPRPNMGTSNRVVLSPLSNFHFGVDATAEEFNINIKDYKPRVTSFWADAKRGVQIGLTQDDILVLNDLA